MVARQVKLCPLPVAVCNIGTIAVLFLLFIIPNLCLLLLSSGRVMSDRLKKSLLWLHIHIHIASRSSRMFRKCIVATKQENIDTQGICLQSDRVRTCVTNVCWLILRSIQSVLTMPKCLQSQPRQVNGKTTINRFAYLHIYHASCHSRAHFVIHMST
jgi:hypothetical protein